MSMVSYAESELSRIKKSNDSETNEMQDLMNNQILEIVKVFAEQDNSGFSAGYELSILDRLLRFKPISPLTGEDDEWEKVGTGVYQNKRCSSVFRNKDGTFEDIDAVTVSDNGGITWFKGGGFRKKVEFPYYPPTHPEKVYIEYTEDVPPGYTSDEYEIITDKPDRIKALYERKRKEFDEAMGE